MTKIDCFKGKHSTMYTPLHLRYMCFFQLFPNAGPSTMCVLWLGLSKQRMHSIVCSCTVHRQHRGESERASEREGGRESAHFDKRCRHYCVANFLLSDFEFPLFIRSFFYYLLVLFRSLSLNRIFIGQSFAHSRPHFTTSHHIVLGSLLKANQLLCLFAIFFMRAHFKRLFLFAWKSRVFP